MVLGLELLCHDVHIDEEAQRLRVALKSTAVRLRTRNCDVIAERGAGLRDETEELS